jgi:glycosyltransferase involved in cell wall biosynthesis
MRYDITVVVPSFNQASFLNDCLASIFSQEIVVEVFVLDGGSTDGSLEIIRKWESNLSGWRSHPDKGQSSAINEGVKLGTAPFVCWLNSDDIMMPGMLNTLIPVIKNSNAPVVYGKVYNLKQSTLKRSPVWVEPFNVRRLSLRNIISQPGAIIRRDAWDSVQGLDESLYMSMDYDLWWRLYTKYGEFKFVDKFVAVNRDHDGTKTNTKRALHYKESMMVVKKYFGSIPIKWWIYQPYSVWFKTLVNKL